MAIRHGFPAAAVDGIPTEPHQLSEDETSILSGAAFG